MEANSNVFYHYCSIESFFNIIKSKKIHLSSVNTMNDSSEGKWVYHILKILSEINEDTDSDNEKIEKVNLRRLHDHSNGYRTFNTLYSFSFSEVGDLLSQWRGYAQDGHGISIGFDFANATPSNNVFNELTKRDSSRSSPVLHKVEYLDWKSVEKVILGAYEKKGNREVYDHIFFSKFHDEISALNLQIKNPAFQEEREWRFSLQSANSDVFPLSTNISFEKPKFKVATNSITSFFEFDFEQVFNKPNPIVKIILGPRCKINETELKLFLDMNGIDSVQVYTSSATYR